MLKKRDAQGLSINVIISAAIALVVLVVLVAIFTGRIGEFSSGLDDITSCKTTCKSVGANTGVSGDNEIACRAKATDAGSYKVRPGRYSDVGDDQICCCIYQSSTSGANQGSCWSIGGSCKQYCERTGDVMEEEMPNECPGSNICCRTA